MTAIGCGFPQTAAVPPPATPAQVTAAKVKYPNKTDAQIAEGHDLFAAKCNKCHSHPDLSPTANEKVDWASVVPKMGKRADLTPEQTDNVLAYILGVREAGKEAPAAAPAATAPPPTE
jgi:cytochrome c5